ncbi:hypothetical protein KACC15558_13270 [Brevibacterium ammoniilyticum]|uniref:Uncharacterized protein n=1 Tax=Brevibacterium ammoniilyticum TaxID=1046555 RepID=A0ABP9U0I9_9MICO
MKAIPRVIAGTAVVLAAVLTAAPLSAGLADLVLNPAQHGKRLAAELTAGPAPSRSAGDLVEAEPWFGGPAEESPGGLDTAEVAPITPRTLDSTVPERSTPTSSIAAGSGAESAEARVLELAADLQSGVDAGEITQADADRVLGDMASYIRGERTWPERVSV